MKCLSSVSIMELNDQISDLRNKSNMGDLNSSLGLVKEQINKISELSFFIEQMNKT
jgi:hypothetical protein